MVRLLGITFCATFILVLLASSFVMPAKAPVSSQVSTEEPVNNVEAPQATAKTKGWLDARVIERDSSGQFHVAGLINGNDARFLVDTGADLVAITVGDAQRLGLAVDRSQFRPIARTASGTGNGVVLTVPRLEVAGQRLENVEAMVVEGLGENLLGQSALRKLGKVQLEGDRLHIGGL